MNRSTFLGGAGCALAATALPLTAVAAESDIELVTPTGSIFGTLTLPATGNPVPVALIIAGSGPTDRDGNSPMLPGKSDTYRLLAQGLAAQGIASVRYDKRGIGQSAFSMASEDRMRFDMYVDDAAAWQKKLRADKRFSKIVIAGHSEGSLIGMISAQRVPADAYVSLEGAGRRGSVILLEQLRKQLPDEMYAQVQTVMNALQSGHAAALPDSWPAPMKTLFRPQVQPYMISWFAYDPAAEIAKLRMPVTIVQGTADVQVTMTDANALKAAASKAQLVVVPGMNHVLRYDPDTSSMQAVIKGYENPALPIDPKVISAVRTAA
jgi:alpha-beta hydrolase superfamily lysophospholipase